jgi:hypothetical protein
VTPDCDFAADSPPSNTVAMDPRPGRPRRQGFAMTGHADEHEGAMVFAEIALGQIKALHQ